MLKFLKDWTLGVAIVVGCTSYLLFRVTPQLEAVGQLTGQVVDVIFPLFIFFTLLITFCKVDYHQLRPHRWHLWMIVCQLLLVAMVVLLVLLNKNSLPQKLLWEAVLTCVIAPCASAAPVVSAKLGGNLNTITAYVLMSNVLTAFLIPAVFPVLEPSAGITFLSSFFVILKRVASILVLPLLLGYVVQHRMKRLQRWVAERKNLAFYTWAISLAMTAGITMRNLLNSGASGTLLAGIAFLSLLMCWVQFGIGRAVGARCGEKANTPQAMFQKNTGMAIWVAYMYLNPVASVGAGCYVLWQNLINSIELWNYGRKNKATCRQTSNQRVNTEQSH